MNLDELRFGSDGLLPVVISDANTGDVLTLAWANRDAIQRTIATRETHLFSRSRNAPWRKGETSGHTQQVVEVTADCDSDAVLYRVIPNGPACHNGTPSCFTQQLLKPEAKSATLAAAMAELERVLEDRKTNAPPDSYTAKLYAGGVDRIGKKIGEEATEVVIAAKNTNDDELAWEVADLLYHVLTLLAHRNVPLSRIAEELDKRRR